MSISETNVKFSDIYNAINDPDHNGTDAISLTDFYNISFTSGDGPTSGVISVGDFKGKTIQPGEILVANILEFESTYVDLPSLETDMLNSTGSSGYQAQNDHWRYYGGYKYSANGLYSVNYNEYHIFSRVSISGGQSQRYYYSSGYYSGGNGNYNTGLYDTKTYYVDNNGNNQEYKGIWFQFELKNNYKLKPTTMSYRNREAGGYTQYLPRNTKLFGSNNNDVSSNPLPVNYDWVELHSISSYSSSSPSYTITTSGYYKYLRFAVNEVNTGTVLSFQNFKLGGYVATSLYGFSSHTFTNCTATSQNGPTLSNCTTAYSSTSWASNTNYFNTSSGIQEWTVPKDGTYKIIAKGAEGGHGGYTSKPGGLGAVIEGVFTLSLGEVIKILVGQKGEEYGDGQSTSTGAGGGGGGGTFVMKSPYNSVSSVLIIAGGGGGSNHHGNNAANAANDINARLPNETGTGGGANNSNYSAGGGGGLLSDGAGNGYGKSLVNGGQGGIGGYSNNLITYRNYGGFGGGGGSGAHEGGGGGGINGGASRHYNNYKGAIGGASYNAGSSPSTPVASNNDHGDVTITLI